MAPAWGRECREGLRDPFLQGAQAPGLVSSLPASWQTGGSPHATSGHRQPLLWRPEASAGPSKQPLPAGGDGACVGSAQTPSSGWAVGVASGGASLCLPGGDVQCLHSQRWPRGQWGRGFASSHPTPPAGCTVGSWLSQALSWQGEGSHCKTTPSPSGPVPAKWSQTALPRTPRLPEEGSGPPGTEPSAQADSWEGRPPGLRPPPG